MRILSTLISFGLLGYGVHWVNLKHPDYKYKALEVINSGNFHTLEARYSSKQIMDFNRKQLLKDDNHKYLPSIEKFSPYLLMEVKYSQSDQQTQEGLILWDLLDGEMVINTNHWEKTHGFSDCINANVEKHEFKVINAIAERGGIIDRDSLVRSLQIENDLLANWIDRCRRKKLVVQTGNHFRLHLQNPRLAIKPETIIDDRLVTKDYKNAERISKRYSHSQIKRIAEAAFGQDFTIKRSLDVYLPIYCVTIENPDGSKHTSYWNAINGRQLHFTSVIE